MVTCLSRTLFAKIQKLIAIERGKGYLTCDPKRNEEEKVEDEVDADHGGSLSNHILPSSLVLGHATTASLPVDKVVRSGDRLQDVLHLRPPVGRHETGTNFFLDKEHDEHLEKNEPNKDAKSWSNSDASVGSVAICLQGPLTEF